MWEYGTLQFGSLGVVDLFGMSEIWSFELLELRHVGSWGFQNFGVGELSAQTASTGFVAKVWCLVMGSWCAP